MEDWERMWIINYTDLAADARGLGDEEMAREALENAKFIAGQARQREAPGTRDCEQKE